MTEFWRPYSRRAAIVRKFLPDIDLTHDLVDGLRIKASLKKHLYLSRPGRIKQEAAVVQKLAALVREDGVIYDLGANIGFYSLVFAANRKRVVHSFEPFDEALFGLRRNIEINGLSNITVHPVVLTDHSGWCRFSIDNITATTSHISAPDEAGKDLPCTDLDSYIEKMKLPQPDLVKLDIEGSEQLIFAGMQNVLRQKRPYIFLEGGVREGGLNDVTGRIVAIDYLKGLGYSIWNLDQTEMLDAFTQEYTFLAVP
jgi:FkbM family methyltransferase